MRSREFISESRRLLVENLSKGSRQVLQSPRLIKAIADHMRTDGTVESPVRQKLSAMTDQEIAEYFLTEIDKLAAEGYEGKAYDRDGKLNVWIADSYGKRYDQWEDVTGVLPQVVTQFNWLKNLTNAIPPVLQRFQITRDENRKYGLVHPQHHDITQFHGAKGLARYLLAHYGDRLERFGEKPDPERAAFEKTARMIKLADNEQYTLLFIQNRGAAIRFGKGAFFCTGNTSQGNGNYDSYSNGSPLIGIQPKDPEIKTRVGYGAQKETAAPEKYQFDAGGGRYGGGASFKDVFDHDAEPELIKNKFPYLFTDLVKGMRENKDAIENPPVPEGVEGYTVVPRINGTSTVPSDADPKKLVKAYNVEEEIKKLKERLGRYWTDQVRPLPDPNAVKPVKPVAAAPQKQDYADVKIVRPSAAAAQAARRSRLPGSK